MLEPAQPRLLCSLFGRRASGAITAQVGVSFVAEKLGKWATVDDHANVVGKPFVFDKANINRVNF